MQDERLREDAKQLLRVAYEREVTRDDVGLDVDLGAASRGAQCRPRQPPPGGADGLHGGGGLGRGGHRRPSKRRRPALPYHRAGHGGAARSRRIDRSARLSGSAGTPNQKRAYPYSTTRCGVD